VPAQVRNGDGDALALAVVENVIRADLNPVEEARAYERLKAEHGDTAPILVVCARTPKEQCHGRAVALARDSMTFGYDWANRLWRRRMTIVAALPRMMSATAPPAPLSASAQPKPSPAATMSLVAERGDPEVEPPAR
jgi:hypothetical protein